MKPMWILYPLSLFVLLICLGNTTVFSVNSAPEVSPSPMVLDTLIHYPPRVKAIIDAKCYNCHSQDGEDEDAKEEFLWDELPTLSKEDLMYAMDDIIESIEDKKMPPEDHLKDHPEDALSDEEAKLLISWADAIADKVMEE